ncbi:type II secretion system minor pseudopilin GspI [Roseovarius sp. 2305UL8-3]|uniref:type II secretion system minor pseudopilin GspI n=1 Tax=Roseovarius conchicola TaxID=3121636 RepID=UPI00352978E8
MRRALKRTTRGLTLLELVIAVMVLSLGSIAAIRATDQSRVAIGGMQTRVLAQIVARNRVQELQLYGAVQSGSLPATVEMGGRSFQITTDTTSTAGGLIEARVAVRGPDGPGAFLVAYVSPLGPGQ